MTKKGRRYLINADVVPLIGFGFSKSSEGVVYFIDLGGRDVHLTYYVRDERKSILSISSVLSILLSKCYRSKRLSILPL